MIETSVGKEFLEIAIEMERNGFAFYESVQTKDEEARNIFKQLAAREKEHEHTFRDILSGLGGYSPEKSCENYQYIKNVANSSIFTGDRANILLSKKTKTDAEAIEAGIGFEKDSILFYSEVRGMVPRKDQDIIDAIVNEEKKHLSELMYIANKIKSG
jgi:rubrerythrin